MPNQLITDEQASVVIAELSKTATSLQSDALHMAPRVQVERARFGRQEIPLEEMSFWLKGLVHACLAFAEGLCHNIREVMLRHASDLEGEVKAKDLEIIIDTDRAQPLDKILRLTFRNLPVLFGVSSELDTSSSDYRAFKEMLRARGRFTHPKTYPDILAFELIATVNSGLEWLLYAWKDLLLACLTRVQEVTDEPERSKRPPFSDQRLEDFRELGRRYAAGQATERDSFGDLGRMIFGLLDDTKRAVDLVTAKNSDAPSLPGDSSFRNLVRFLFTEIEGSVFAAAYYLYRYRFTDEKPTKELLIGDHQDVRERIVSTLESFSRHFGTDCCVRRDGSGWEAFAAARKLRNRLLHPEGALDLHFRNGELDQVLATRDWWHGEVHECLVLTEESEKLRVLLDRERLGLRDID